MSTFQNLESLTQAVHDYFSQDPNACVYSGINQHYDELPDPSAERHHQYLSDARTILSKIKSFDASKLDFNERLDVELAQGMFEKEVLFLELECNGKPEFTQKPKAAEEISGGIFMFFVNDPRPEGERILNITHRIEKIPQYLKTLQNTLDHPVERWAEMDKTSIRELPSFFKVLVDWAEGLKHPDAARLKKAVIHAETAITVYLEFLSQRPTVTSFSVGAEKTKQIIQARGIALSDQEIHKIAVQFLQSNKKIIEELKTKLNAKYQLPNDTTAEALQEFLNKKYCVKLSSKEAFDEILDRYREEKDRILKFIQRKNLFPIFPEQDMQIMKTPAFMEPSIPAGAMLSPPAFRPGKKVSNVYLTLRPDLVDEHTEISIPAMMVHEGIPGHHLQLSWAARHSSVIRRHVNAMEHAEGWTTMLEDYMLDVGYASEVADEVRFIGKWDIARLAARVAIDLFFMSGDIRYLDIGVPIKKETLAQGPFVAAKELLIAITGFTPGRADAELNWYSQERGYPLSYLTGNHLVWKLKRDFIAAQEKKLSTLEMDRKFHEIYLKSGNMPVKFLRKVFEHEKLI